MSTVVLAVIQQPDTGNNGAGALGFVIVAALFVAGWFLYRSLRHHLGRIDFVEGADAGAGDSLDGSGRPSNRRRAASTVTDDPPNGPIV